MSKINITKYMFEKMSGINNVETRQNIIDFMRKYQIKNTGYITQQKHKIIFKNQIGGTEFEIELKDNQTYNYYINDIEPEGKSQYRMWFVNMDNSIECASLLFGKKNSKNNVLRIEGISNYSDCVKCQNSKHNFKIGDILMQIIIKLVKTNEEFTHIKCIELSDTSKISCYDKGLELKYLRTITNGIPYYAKFGFKPILKTDYKNVFVYNRNNFKLNKTILNTELFDIINKKKVNMSNSTYNVYRKYLKKHIQDNENINPITFLTKTIEIIDNSIKKNNSNIKTIENKNELEGLCDFISKIYMDIYKSLGYKTYDENLWMLKIVRN